MYITSASTGDRVLSADTCNSLNFLSVGMAAAPRNKQRNTSAGFSQRISSVMTPAFPTMSHHPACRGYTFGAMRFNRDFFRWNSDCRLLVLAHRGTTGPKNLGLVLTNVRCRGLAMLFLVVDWWMPTTPHNVPQTRMMGNVQHSSVSFVVL